MNKLEDLQNRSRIELLNFIEQIKNLQDSNIASKLNYQLHIVTNREEIDIMTLTGIDVKGYTHNLSGGSVNHINIRHGANGVHDDSMAFTEDIARIAFVLENYHSVRCKS